jgi:hypothetical protein
MGKTPDELAEEYTTVLEAVPLMHYLPIEPCRKAYLAGYQAAKEHAHAALEEAEARIQELQDQVAGVSKVMPDTCEHILDMEKMVDVNGWISVKTKLPEDRKNVLGVVCGQIRFGRIELISTDPGQFHWIDQDIYIDKGHYALTYWQEIPEPPKEES